jgi:hypothetical protein
MHAYRFAVAGELGSIVVVARRPRRVAHAAAHRAPVIAVR